MGYDALVLRLIPLKLSFKQAISQLSCGSVSKRILVQKLSYENKFDLHENEHVRGTHSFTWMILHEDSF